MKFNFFFSKLNYFFFILPYKEISKNVSDAIVLGHRLLARNRDPVILNNVQLDYILKSFGHYQIDVCKYLGNACILQANILNGNVDDLKLPDDVEAIFNFLTDHECITDLNVSAKKFVDGHPTFSKKKQINKK